MFRIVVFLFLTTPATCFSSCWLDVYTDNKIDIYLNYCSLVQVGKYKKVWTRWVFADNQVSEESPAKEYDEMKMLYYFDCALKSSTVVQRVDYSPEPENKVVSSRSVKFESSNLIDVVPDTYEDAVLKAACRKYNK